MFSKVNIKLLLITTICMLSKSAQIGEDKEDTSKLIQAIFGNNSQHAVPTATSKKSNCTCVPYYLCSIGDDLSIIDRNEEDECDFYLDVCCSPMQIRGNSTNANIKDKGKESTHSVVTDVTNADDCVCVAYYRCDRTGTDIIDINENDAKCKSYLDLCCSPSNILKD